MLNFRSTLMDSTSSQFLQKPNTYINPNLDHRFIPYYADQLNDSMYCRIANYLMSDEDHECFEKNLLEDKNTIVSENSNGKFDGSSNLVDPVAHSIKKRRELKKYNTQEDLRFAFRTKTDLEVMDDGYKWRKYGKKMVKNSPNPR
ncbi:probable WRKY transcription factor 50 [Phtheirospermum japonicum]|uniref:Probable WRKY transcription factor 50 n=1 Tax=Phtheirospermum japonicum TaxID=374723 RepID=A0A830C2K8_9LAMI|nr:probable WRKY transcription factor 50 [Phtheirospermum japonicum]